MMILDTDGNTNTTKNRNVSLLFEDSFKRKKLNPYYSKKYHKKSLSTNKDIKLKDSNQKLQLKRS